MRKVLYQIPYPFFFSQHAGVGGHIAHALGIVEGFLNSGYEVHVLAHEGKNEFEIIGAKFIGVEAKNKSFWKRQIWLRSFFKARKKLLKKNSYDITYLRYSVSATPWLILRYKSSKVKEIIEVNSYGSQQISLLKKTDKWAISSYDLTLVVSQDLVKFSKQNLGNPGSNVELIENAVATSRFRFSKQKKKDEYYRISFAGLLKPDYGLEYVIDAARLAEKNSLPYVFDIYGSGPHEDTLKELSADLDNITFHGSIEFEKVPDILSEKDILLYSTDQKNSFQSPIKIYEYLALGIPIVSASTNQTKNILSFLPDEQFYEIGNSKEMLKSIQYVIQNYNEAIITAKEGQDITRNNHSWDSRVSDIMDNLK